jgi:hypothetical protein
MKPINESFTISIHFIFEREILNYQIKEGKNVKSAII